MKPEPIAIVGIGGIFPDAPDLGRFWANVRAKACAAREVPAGRWLLAKEDAFEARKGAPDKVYSLKACLIDGFRLDPSGLDLPPDFIARLDPAFHLALHAARSAFEDAKVPAAARARTGVAIGNIVLPTDSSSAWARELLLPAIAEKVLGRRFAASGAPDPINRFVAGLPGGAVAKALGLGGGSFTLDAACASSLYALKLACEELRAGRADVMLTGGVSRPESLYTQMGFSQLRALSASGTPSPFDESADGLVVGEGAGIFVLKRAEDARRDGDRVYGLIAGIGLSNDVGGSLLAPNTVGQLRAMRSAYKEAGWSASDADYVECHATGTPTGDPVEVASLLALWGERGWSAGQCALGSVKSNVGHLLTAAGSAGLMKVLLGFKNETLPPSANFKRSGPQIRLEDSPFRVQTEVADWRARDGARRAAVSAFGFGGINAHVLVEQYDKRTRSHKISTRPARTASAPVAIVGMSAHFGSLKDLRSFQEAVLAGRTAVLRRPDERWWGAAGGERWQGFYLSDVEVEAAAYRIPPKELEEMLPQQLLMLETAARAIKDAKLPEEGRDRAGVFIGLGLDLNTTHFHLRWSLLDKARAWSKELGWSLKEAELSEWAGLLREAAGPALSANRTMGALGGIVASRVAREFSIGGPSFTLSSEETSGLRALETAVRALQRGELDSAVVGAVDVAGDVRAVLGTDAGRPFTGTGRARPFDESSDGAVPGEGAAALVLKRLDDALRDGDRVYAVIKGLGSASGGGVDRPAPTSEAYVSALRRAYADAEVDPSTVGYLETHGSGGREEDRAEAAGLAEFYGIAETKLPCALGSVKSSIGHAGAACGLAGVVKAALALYQEILPAFAPIDDPLPELARAASRFHIPPRAQYWLRNRAEGPRRAGVSALGVDGNCAHVVLEGLERRVETAQSLIERRQPLGARAEGLFVLEADDAAGLLAGLSGLKAWAAPFEPDAPVEALARLWWRKRGSEPEKKLGLAIVARGWAELLKLAAAAESSIRENPDRPMAADRVQFTTRSPLQGSLAFVFPGSGNQYVGMGAELGVEWPEVLRALDAEHGYLRGQLVPELFSPWRFAWKDGWRETSESEIARDFKAMIFGSVSHGAFVSDLVRRFGVSPRVVIGYSLGETAGLFALRAWTARDEMLRRMNESSLFVSDLAGPCEAARRFWNLTNDERVDWVLGVIDRPAETVRMAAKGMERVALLIVNAPLECVIGGYRKAVDSLVDGLGCVFLPLQGVSTVHFEAAKLVEKKYRDLHLLPTTPPAGVAFYSGAFGKAYELTRESAADSITTQAVRQLDFAALIKRAYDEGARLFVELGPQASCTRMIDKILGPLPHMARSACVKGQDQVSTVLRLLAHLSAERVPVDLQALYGEPTLCVGHREQASRLEHPVRTRLGSGAPQIRSWTPRPRPALVPAPSSARPSAPSRSGPSCLSEGRPPSGSRAVPLSGDEVVRPAAGVAASLLSAQAAAAKAHEVFLRLSRGFAEAQGRNIAFHNELIAAANGTEICPPTAPKPAAQRGRLLNETGGGLGLRGASIAAPRLERSQCLEFAVGKIGKVLGERFAHADAYPTRVRLPDEPLMLVDRITQIEGEPNSMSSGRVVTEHDVLPGAWYLDGGRIPTCIAVEAGQADLFLSGWLGIDAKTQGLAVYRLLDAEVCFHAGLPKPGEVIRYDIRIERFARHGDIWLFFFNFESTVGGRPLLSMRKGCAGFFTQRELAAGKGVVRTDEEMKPVRGRRPADWQDLALVSGIETYGDLQLAALRAGDLAACFGPAFAALPFTPETLPSGRMKLVDRVLELDPKGGRYGLGRIRAEADIRPDDWHLVCHFIDDNVMPGTLMYECCLHTLRVLLLRMGWVGAKGTVWHEPKPGVASQLKCRGQVLPTTKKVVYEIEVKELGYGPEPFVIADALMYSDGKPIVQILDMSARIGGLDKESLSRLWERPVTTQVPLQRNRRPPPGGGRREFAPNGGANFPLGRAEQLQRPMDLPPAIFDRERILAFAVGKPSEAFGKPYEVFDSERVIARLPGPPYQFLDRITEIRGCEPFVLKAGATIAAEYDVPPDAWYFASNGQPTMPFAVLLEAALQPCGWLAAYLGSALTSPVDLSFRNLGGTATQSMDVGPDAGTLATRVTMTKVSQSGGMIIQNYDFEVSCGGTASRRDVVYRGSTEFGFFTKAALSQQLGVRGASPFAPKEAGRPLDPARLPGMPDAKLLMLDSVEIFADAVRGVRKVDPDEWFFKAHFYQDPVCPGSLGLESFIQLLKAAARERWGAGRFESMVLGRPHSWLYRGQYTPVNKLVEVSAVIKEADDAAKLLRADGHLKVDGLTIYQMKDFTLRLA